MIYTLQDPGPGWGCHKNVDRENKHTVTGAMCDPVFCFLGPGDTILGPALVWLPHHQHSRQDITMAILPFIAQNMNIDTTHIPSYPPSSLPLCPYFPAASPGCLQVPSIHKYPYFRNNASEQRQIDKIIVSAPPCFASSPRYHIHGEGGATCTILHHCDQSGAQ